MKYDIKVVSADSYELSQLRLGSRVQYIDVNLGDETYRGIIDPKKCDLVIIPEHLADKALTILVNEPKKR